jgi:hypothetical protein
VIDGREGPDQRTAVGWTLRGIAALILGGLTAMEVLALAVGFVAVVGLLWATGAVPPEHLVTDPWLRAGWALTLIGVLRPLTWIPFVLLFLGLRALGRSIAGRAASVLVNGVAAVGALVIVALSVWIVLSIMDGATRWILSVLGLLSGTVGFSGLGTETGSWEAGRVAAIVAVFVLVRPLVPPLRLDLDLEARPLLGFVDGMRGTVDRWLVAGAAAVAVISAVVSFLSTR